MGNKGLRYAVRDGFTNLRRHPFILIASISTMFLMLLLLGAFFLFAMNANYLLRQAGEQPPVEIQFRMNTAEETVRYLDQQLENHELIREHRVFSPRENMDEFKARMGKSELFDEFNYEEHIPWTIMVRLTDPSLGASFKEEIMKYPGVFDVMMENQLMNALNMIIRNVGIGISIFFPILCLISVLIISNMIRMIALSRATELSIMKTMGATNAYIRIPFVIEGLFVAFISSTLALAVLFFLYRALLKRFQGTAGSLQLIELSSIALPLIAVVFVFGFVISGVTSALAVKRHIDV